MLKSIVKNNLRKTNECIILLAPLVIITTFILIYFNFIYNHAENLSKFYIAFIAVVIMSSVCFSAWFYLLKKYIKLADKIFIYDLNRSEEIKKIFVSAHKGISEFFLPFCFFLLFYFLIFGYFIILFSDLCTNYIFTNADTNNYLNPVNIFTFAMVFLMQLPILYIIPEIIYGTKNPYTAMLNAIKKFVISYKQSLLLFIFIYIISVTAYIISLFLLSFSPYFYFLISLVIYYIILYIFVLVFSAYESFFLKQ